MFNLFMSCISCEMFTSVLDHIIEKMSSDNFVNEAILTDIKIEILFFTNLVNF